MSIPDLPTLKSSTTRVEGGSCRVRTVALPFRGCFPCQKGRFSDPSANTIVRLEENGICGNSNGSPGSTNSPRDARRSHSRTRWTCQASLDSGSKGSMS